MISSHLKLFLSYINLLCIPEDTGSFHLSYKVRIRHKTMLTYRQLFPSQDKKRSGACPHPLTSYSCVSFNRSIQQCNSLQVISYHSKLNHHHQSKLLPVEALWCHSLGVENNQYLRKWNGTNELDVFTLEGKKNAGKTCKPSPDIFSIEEEVQFALKNGSNIHQACRQTHLCSIWGRSIQTCLEEWKFPAQELLK